MLFYSKLLLNQRLWRASYLGILIAIRIGEGRKKHVPQIVPQIHHFSISLDSSNELKLIISSIRLDVCTSSFSNECAYTF